MSSDVMGILADHYNTEPSSNNLEYWVRLPLVTISFIDQDDGWKWSIGGANMGGIDASGTTDTIMQAIDDVDTRYQEISYGAD